jgi:membrane protease YdiL (CAAX protease family)
VPADFSGSPLPDIARIPTRTPTLDDIITPRHRIMRIAGTLVVGTALLAATLAATSDSRWFYALGLLSGVTWIAGAVVSGPIPWRGPGTVAAGHAKIAGPTLLGVGLFGAFFAAKLLSNQIPVLSHSIASVLGLAHTGSRPLVLAVALVNAIGEELFFRGTIQSALPRQRAATGAVAVYVVVTIATLNVALIASAFVMGAIFSAQRRATASILAPIVTHLTWSTLMVMLLPR